MTEVRALPGGGAGLFATVVYAEGDEIFAESPLAVLSAAAPSSSDDVPAQFNPSSLNAAPSTEAASGKTTGGSSSNASPSSILLNDLVLPKDIMGQLSTVFSGYDLQYRTSKLRGMLVALASYSANPPSEEAKRKLFELYHPSLDGDNNDAEKDALGLANLALQCGKKMAAADSALKSLLKKNKEEALKLLLVYSCNSFEGGRIYHQLSRANHSCNPNAVVVEGRGSKDVSVLKAACDIAAGEEICISYLGRYLYAGYPVRQKVLRANKHFVCRCERCGGDSGNDGSGDLASHIPCPACHPRSGRYLEEDVMFASDEDGVKVCYAVPTNGLKAEERSLRCGSCNTTTTYDSLETKEGQAIKYMCMAEEKVFDRLQSCSDGGDEKGASEEAETEVDQQFLQMATGICGAQHWTTHFLTLSLIEESLASFHATLMTMGQDQDKDAEAMEELFVEIAEAADGIEKAYAFASSLKMNLDPAHWLFDYTVGLARTLVGLGDVKSQKYGATWIEKVESYAEKFEGDGMRKVVIALRDAWKRGESEEPEGKSDVQEWQQDNNKRQKIE
ncbi:hypothetical protein ACHAXT_002875 [Thalassiosira profunda]